MNDTNNDKTVPAHSVPPVSSGIHGHGNPLLRSGMMLPPEAPGILGRIGKYPVIRILGEGGMGQVLLAREPVTDSQVAIKIIKPEFLHKQWAVHRFLTEARHMFRMSHPSIIRVMDVSDRPEGPYFVMPFMAGGSLAEKIKPGAALPFEVLLPWARAVADALHHAHTHGITHRDLKPSNILLDAEDHAYLADFGLLRTFFNDTMVDAGQSQMEGTVPYMSPAVAAGKAEDTRCDIYSFGCLLYEMLTGQPPYQGPTVDAVLKLILAGPPPPIRQLNPNAPARLAAIADHAMARTLRDRYATMGDVVSDLDRVTLGKDPIGPHGREKRRSDTIRVCADAGVTALIGLAVFRSRKAMVAAGIVAFIGLTAFGIPKYRGGKPFDRAQDTSQAKHGSVAATGLDNPPAGQMMPIELPGKVVMKFCYCPPGSFLMGSPSDEIGRDENEGPVKVRLSQGYWLAQTECTQQQWTSVMGHNPSQFKGNDLPVEKVSWDDAQKFITRLNEAKALPDGLKAALPTEAQWEYACRAGTTTAYSFGDALKAQQANFYMDSTRKTCAVASYAANAWGLYDMHGNVWEWCEDWLADQLPGGTDPVGVASGSCRVVRGGGWNMGQIHSRSAIRSSSNPESGHTGFRAALMAAPVHTESITDPDSLQHALAQTQTIAAQAAPVILRLEKALAVKDKFGAEDVLAELEALIPNDVVMAGLRERVAAVPGPRHDLTVDFGGGVTMDMVLIRPGTFTMGSNKGDKNAAHQVTLTKPFYLGKYEVTQEQWERIMGGNPSDYKGAKHPVTSMNWNDCQRFLKMLQEKVPGATFRLPTEAEWEYACRAGTTSYYSYGNDMRALGDYAWYAGNSNKKIHPVGEKKPNAWGLHDMHGNVCELCADLYGNYPVSAVTDPQGPSSGTLRVVRGGAWDHGSGNCRVTDRGRYQPLEVCGNAGLRLVRGAVP